MLLNIGRYLTGPFQPIAWYTADIHESISLDWTIFHSLMPSMHVVAYSCLQDFSCLLLDLHNHVAGFVLFSTSFAAGGFCSSSDMHPVFSIGLHKSSSPYFVADPLYLSTRRPRISYNRRQVSPNESSAKSFPPAKVPLKTYAGMLTIPLSEIPQTDKHAHPAYSPFFLE